MNKLKLLAVDDEPRLLEALVFGLTASGLSVLQASNADDASALLRQHRDIAVLMSDIRMPGRSGLELLEETIANRTDEDAVEVVIITGHASMNLVSQAMRGGAIDYLAKPFTLAEATISARRALERASARRARASKEAERSQMLDAARATIAEFQGRVRRAGIDSHGKLGRLRQLSHELRTPMVPILGYGELLRDDTQNSDTIRAYGQEITRGAMHLLSAIDRLLELERLSEPDLRPNKAPHLAAGLVARAWQGALHRAAGKQVELRLDMPDGCRLIGDNAMLLVALGELLDNAIGQSVGGGIIAVAARGDLPENLISVRDEGAGWPRGAAPNLAEMRGSTNGLGLGLALALRVAELHGGRLSLQTPPGGGAMATLAWPS